MVTTAYEYKSELNYNKLRIGLKYGPSMSAHVTIADSRLFNMAVEARKKGIPIEFYWYDYPEHPGSASPIGFNASPISSFVWVSVASSPNRAVQFSGYAQISQGDFNTASIASLYPED